MSNPVGYPVENIENILPGLRLYSVFVSPGLGALFLPASKLEAEK